MNSFLKKNFLVAILSAATFTNSFSQLVVTPSASATQLAQTLAGPGVIVSNAVLTAGAVNQAGTFSSTATNLGMTDGIILTSGTVQNCVGPNVSTGINATLGTAGYALLDPIVAPNLTEDACVLEFDVKPLSDTLRFEYVFGSDEYTEWVNSAYNDVFAFFISGPGITGQPNIALVPGTSTAVSINNVNCTAYPQYYVCNETGGGALCNAANCPATTTLEYDGFTVVMIAQAIVQPCETYHLILAVADVGDGNLDSGVFLKAGSLTSTGVTLSSHSSYIDPNNNLNTAVEDCNNGSFSFVLNPASSDTVVFHYTIGGTATSGVDYQPIADSVVFLPGQTAVSIPVTVNHDGVSEGVETIILYEFLPCSSEPVDSVVLQISDFFTVVMSNDTAVCPGSAVPLWATGGVSYAWSPAFGLTDPNIATPTAIVFEPIVYTVTVTNQFNCSSTGDVFVDVFSLGDSMFAAPHTINFGNSSQLSTVHSAQSYSWQPSNSLDNPFVINPVATPSATTTYTVTIVDYNGCAISDTVIVYVDYNALVKVPSAFTPNSDGHNDLLKVITRGIFLLDEFKIYNRWGEMIYETSNILDGWDGKYNGEPAEVGVYIYTVEGKDLGDNPIEANGNVTLLR